MFYVFLLLWVAFALAKLSAPPASLPVTNQGVQQPDREQSFNPVAYLLLLLLLIIFSGTRTFMNDTALYILNFKYQISADFSRLQYIDWQIGANPGFTIYQMIIKSMLSEHFTCFLLLSSVIVVTSYLSFFKKYSADFALAVFLFIASTGYNFTMAAQKQVLAMAMGLWVFRFMMDGRWIASAILLFIAITFHPYIFMFAVIPFVIGPVWRGKSLLILSGSVLFVSLLQTVMNVVTQVTSSFGDNYDMANYIADGIGVNIFRLAVFAVTPALSFIFRREINDSGDKVLQTCCNLSLVSFAFMFIAAFSEPNSFGRLAGYFEPFSYVAMAGILSTCIRAEIRPLIYCGCYLGYMGFYFMFYTKYGVSLFVDYYRHINLLDVIF